MTLRIISIDFATIIIEKYPVMVVKRNFNIETRHFTLFRRFGHLLLDLPASDIKFEKQVCNRLALTFLLSKSMVLKEFGEIRDNVLFFKEYTIFIPFL